MVNRRNKIGGEESLKLGFFSTYFDIVFCTEVEGELEEVLKLLDAVGDKNRVICSTNC